ncbi:N-acetylmuramoyl-L-alanine amidase-like domain-containing protein [uncultured Draconibacterium sp.]|uniref:N-acetylmuramoyl-L-alanine amidase-like domain-containing protein n=1 Tax=uncultured Draconibacterium sp. TaxID=1573823 RepID=UPI0025F44C04|nr:N-acetylmuramoyl-L-alanine amidase-like domain-containing protein [uncultured Draconibacterium sp.]
MKKKIILLISVFFLLYGNAFTQVSSTIQDEQIFNQLLCSMVAHKDKTTAELVVMCSKLLMNTPYTAHTLEIEPEHLVVNLREMDCTTFAENCLAIAQTVKTRNPDFDTFTYQLKQIRYRNGQIKGYPSRLHYFSDWIYNNDQKMLVESLSKELVNTPYHKTINFMSKHPNSYPQLKNNTAYIQDLTKIEHQLTRSKLFYIPTEKLESIKHLLQDGDIFGITTNIEGLDIIHVGIIVFKNDELYFMHASTNAKKVVLSSQTLYKYLSERKTANGIMVARPL